MTAKRIGLIVPSSNTTMETELAGDVPAAFGVVPGRAVHVPLESDADVARDGRGAAAMDRDSDRCAIELTDAECDVLAVRVSGRDQCPGSGYASRF